MPAIAIYLQRLATFIKFNPKTIKRWISKVGGDIKIKEYNEECTVHFSLELHYCSVSRILLWVMNLSGCSKRGAGVFREPSHLKVGPPYLKVGPPSTKQSDL